MDALQLPRFGLEVRPDRTRAVLTISGELDLATAPMVRDALDDLWEVGWSHVALDLAGVSFMDSTGMSVLLTLVEDAEARGRRLTVATSCACLERLLTVLGLEHALPRS